MFYGAIDLGGTKIYTVISDEQGKILAHLRTATAKDASPEVVALQMRDSLDALLQEIGGAPDQLTGVGVCVAGYFDQISRRLVYSPNLQKWEDIPIEGLLTECFGVPVKVENDANAAAVGEWAAGAAKGKKDVLYLTVSTGIGAGLILNNRLYRGSRGLAGEAGHIPVNPDGVICGCGRSGCLETEASGTAIARLAAQAATTGKSEMLLAYHQKKASAGGIEAEDVFAAAKRGDETAQRIIRRTTGYLAMGIAGMINMFNPEMIVIGGGVSQAGEALLEPLREQIKIRAIPALTEHLTIKRASLGTESGVIGMLNLGER